MLAVNIQHGTHAGWKTPMKEQHQHDWRCPGCGAWNRYFWRRCPNCGHPRPDDD